MLDQTLSICFKYARLRAAGSAPSLLCGSSAAAANTRVLKARDASGAITRRAASMLRLPLRLRTRGQNMSQDLEQDCPRLRAATVIIHINS